MTGSRIVVTLAILLPVMFGMQRALSLASSPAAPPVVRTPPKAIRPLPADLEGFLRASRRLAPADVARLRARVARDPGDAPARALLLDYTMFGGADPALKAIHNAQAVWFAANLPGSPVLDGRHTIIDEVTNANAYDLMKRLFDEATKRNPKDADVLANYANLILVPETETAVGLLSRAAALDPKNPKRYARLGFAHSLASRGVFGRNDPQEAALAAENYRKARALGGDVSAKEALGALFDSGRLDAAARDARAALTPDADADTVHAAHTYLGRIALRRGDVAEAKAHLLASAKVEGSPVLGSFGPMMELAQELLEKGERPTVVAYLKATGKFWDDERQVRWTKTVERGGTPDWN